MSSLTCVSNSLVAFIARRGPFDSNLSHSQYFHLSWNMNRCMLFLPLIFFTLSGISLELFPLLDLHSDDVSSHFGMYIHTYKYMSNLYGQMRLKKVNRSWLGKLSVKRVLQERKNEAKSVLQLLPIIHFSHFPLSRSFQLARAFVSSCRLTRSFCPTPFGGNEESRHYMYTRILIYFI